MSGFYKVSDWKMVNVRSFCGKRTQHCEIASAANEEEKEKTETADIVMIGLPLSG